MFLVAFQSFRANSHAPASVSLVWWLHQVAPPDWLTGPSLTWRLTLFCPTTWCCLGSQMCISVHLKAWPNSRGSSSHLMSKRLIAKFLSTQKMGACSVSTPMGSYTDVSHSISVLRTSGWYWGRCDRSCVAGAWTWCYGSTWMISSPGLSACHHLCGRLWWFCCSWFWAFQCHGIKRPSCRSGLDWLAHFCGNMVHISASGKAAENHQSAGDHFQGL